MADRPERPALSKVYSQRVTSPGGAKPSIFMTAQAPLSPPEPTPREDAPVFALIPHPEPTPGKNKSADSTAPKLFGSDAQSQLELGDKFWSGVGQPQSFPNAAQCYRVAAQMGSSDAMVRLAICLHQGLGEARNKPEANSWLEKAKGLGNWTAQVGSLTHICGGTGLTSAPELASYLHPDWPHICAGDWPHICAEITLCCI